MPVPKKRVSRSQRNQRRAHDFLTPTAAIEVCPSCGATKERHRVCSACGTYRGREVFPTVATDVDEAGDPTAAE